MKQNTNQLDNQHLFSHQYFNSKQKSNLSKLKTSSYYFNLLIFLLFTNTGFAQICATGGDEISYGNGNWIGYVYDHAGGSGIPASTPFVTYKGHVSENEIFDRNWDVSKPSCANGNNNFAVKYRMTKNFPCGMYVFKIGGDDGVRLSVDGGLNWLVSDWSDHAYREKSSVSVHLNGNKNIVLEFYEKGGVARVSFSYTAKLGPTAVNAGPDQSVCSGAIVHLTGFDDGLITPLYSWTGGIVVSGGNTLNPLVNPITTRSYTLNATLNGCTVSDAVLVTVKPIPTATLTSTNSTICYGNKVTLSGTVSVPNSSFMLNNGVGAVTATGTTWSKTILPTSTSNYSIHTVIGDGCPGSATGSALVTLPTKGASLASDGESAICLVNAGEIVHFYHESGRFITTVQASGTSLGYTTATVFVDPVAFVVPACGQPSNPHYFTATLGRRWVIEPTDQGAAIVTLSFDGKEYESLQNAAAATSSNPNDNTLVFSDLKLSKYSGGNVNSTFDDNCGQGVTNLYSNSGNGNLSASFPGFDVNARFLNYAVPGFSEFWLHGATISPLPVTLTSLSATCDETVMFSWTTASEQNSDRFVIEKSRDGKSWFYVGAQAAAGNSNRVINYTQSDHDSWIGMNYYRLRQVDFNEEQTIFGPISVSCERNESSIEVFPNPNNGSFTVNISSNHKQSEAFLYLTDMSDKIIHYQKVDVGVGTKQIIFDNLEIQNGTYFLTLQTSNKDLKPVKIVVI